MIDFGESAGRPITRFAPWNHGAPPGIRPTDPAIQVQRTDEHTFVLRQSKGAHYEAPFLYLMMGNRRAVLFDTGATPDSSVRAVVDGLLAEWLGNHPRDGYELLVAHSHSHDDHVEGDGSFQGRAGTVVVGHDAESIREFFGFTADLDTPAILDLGGRRLELLQAPGHHPSSIVVYDPWTGWLLTGDTVYPGRLYVQDAAAFVSTMGRLGAFAEARRVSHILGCHIEMSTTAGVDYPVGATWQPDEPPLPMSVAQLEAISAVAHVAILPGRYVYDDFVIVSRDSDSPVAGS